MNRRGFIKTILAAGMAPAVVRGGILMPVRQLWTPPALIVTLYDMDGAPVVTQSAEMIFDGSARYNVADIVFPMLPGTLRSVVETVGINGSIIKLAKPMLLSAGIVPSFAAGALRITEE